MKSKKKTIDTLNYILAKPNGEWIGKGFGDTKETLFQYKLNYMPIRRSVKCACQGRVEKLSSGMAGVGSKGLKEYVIRSKRGRPGIGGQSMPGHVYAYALEALSFSNAAVTFCIASSVGILRRSRAMTCLSKSAPTAARASLYIFRCILGSQPPTM